MSNECVAEEVPLVLFVGPGPTQDLPSEEPSNTEPERDPRSSTGRAASPAWLELAPITTEDVPTAPRFQRFRNCLQKVLTVFDDSRANRAAMMFLVLLGILVPLHCLGPTTAHFASESRVAEHFYSHSLLRGRLKTKFTGCAVHSDQTHPTRSSYWWRNWPGYAHALSTSPIRSVRAHSHWSSCVYSLFFGICHAAAAVRSIGLGYGKKD